MGDETPLSRLKLSGLISLQPTIGMREKGSAVAVLKIKRFRWNDPDKALRNAIVAWLRVNNRK